MSNSRKTTTTELTGSDKDEMPPVGEGGRRRSARCLTEDSTPPLVALESLSAMVEAISPHARLTMLSIRGEAVEIVESVGAGPSPACVTPHVPDADAFTYRLLNEGMFVLDRTNLHEDLLGIAEEVDFELAYFALLRARSGVVEFVAIDEPGAALDLGEREQKLFMAAVSQARVALDNAELRIRAARRERILEAVARLGVVFTSLLDLKQTAEQVAEYASLLLGLPAFALLYRREGTSAFVVLASEGLPPGSTDRTMQPIEIAALDVRRPGETESIRLSAGDAGTLFSDLVDAGLHNAIVAPLVVGDDQLRGILLGLDRRKLDLADEEREAFHLLATQATNAIWNAERHDAEIVAQREAKRELETTALLLHAADLFASSLDLGTVLRGLIDTVIQATGRDRIVVSLLDEDSDELVVRASRGEDALRRGTRINANTLAPQLRTSILEKATAVIDYESSKVPERIRRRAETIGARLVLSVPLVTQDRLIGHIGIDDRGARCAFTRREIEIVEGIASLAAVALENARLFEQTRTIAEMLQQALLTLPEQIQGVDFAHAYQAASTKANVGGDFYDIFEVGNDCIGVVVGDIAGKGLKAAVLTSFLKDTLRAHTAEADKTPARILHLTNEIFYKTTAIEQFATVFFGILDRRDGHFTYANAGHTTGVIVSSEHRVQGLLPTGPILGAFPGVEFSDREVRLGLGETLFLYTDGLTEARRGTEQLGEERVIDLLASIDDRAPDCVIEHVIGQLDTFTEGVLRDDLALFALRRRENDVG